MPKKLMSFFALSLALLMIFTTSATHARAWSPTPSSGVSVYLDRTWNSSTSPALQNNTGRTHVWVQNTGHFLSVSYGVYMNGMYLVASGVLPANTATSFGLQGTPWDTFNLSFKCSQFAGCRASGSMQSV